MLFYLDNWMSAIERTAVQDQQMQPRRSRSRDGGAVQAAAACPRPANARTARCNAQRMPRGLNENYGRELMELHTLGVDGGYTQKDVTEVARAFTGWTIQNPRMGGGYRLRSAGPRSRARRSCSGT